MGTEFSTCKTGIDRMNVTSCMQSLSLKHEKLKQTHKKQCSVEIFCASVVSPVCKGLWDRIGIFSKLKMVCDIDTV